jgi:multidrug resistance protein, MATE family
VRAAPHDYQRGERTQKSFLSLVAHLTKVPAMTVPQAIRTTGVAPARVWRVEMAETVKLALPIALTQLGQIAMMTTDLALIGRLGDQAVAAAALAHTVLFTVFVVGMGLTSAVAPLAAQAYGARKPRMVRRALRVGLWASVILGVPLTLVQLWGGEILLALGQSGDTAALADRYLAGLAWCLMPSWFFMALRNFMSAVNRPEPGLWITLAAIPANAVLAYALIYGAFGLPRFDMLGAGIATTLVSIGMCVAAIWVSYTRRPFKKYRVLGRWWRADWVLMRKLIVVGAPIAGAFLLEYGLFAAAAQLMGWIGTTALAAHQIALQVAAIMFMVPFGISMAASVRVGQAAGRADPAAVRRAGFSAIALGVAFMAAMTLLVGATRNVLPLLFLGFESPDPQTVSLAASLLVLGASFFIFDGVQTIAAGSLRGLNDTRVPLLYAALSFWLVGFSSAWILAFTLGLGAYGIWIGLSLGIAVYALLLIWRFHRLTARHYLPEIAAPA